MEKLTLAFDTLSSDYGEEEIAAGLDQAARSGATCRIIAVGTQWVLQALREQGKLHESIEIVDSDFGLTTRHDIKEVIAADRSSVAICANMAAGDVDGFVSFGDTRTAIVWARRAIGMIPGIRSTPLALFFPTGELLPNGRLREIIMLDAGANSSNCTAEKLVEFARLGTAYATGVQGIEVPRFGVLANGSEPEKGTDMTREALRILDGMPGFIGHMDASSALDVDVMVAPGYEGNISFKSAELGMRVGLNFVKLFSGKYFCDCTSELSSLLMAIKKELDPGCQPLFGPKKFVGIGHGSAKRDSVARAVFTAADLASLNIAEKMAQHLDA